MTRLFTDDLPSDPVERYPEMFPERPRLSRWRWITFERVMSTLSAVAGVIILAFTLGGKVTTSQRDVDDLKRRVDSVERRVDALEVVRQGEREQLRQLLDQYYVRQVELDPIRRDLQEIKALMMRRTP